MDVDPDPGPSTTSSSVSPSILFLTSMSCCAFASHTLPCSHSHFFTIGFANWAFPPPSGLSTPSLLHTLSFLSQFSPFLCWTCKVPPCKTNSLNHMKRRMSIRRPAWTSSARPVGSSSSWQQGCLGFKALQPLPRVAVWDGLRLRHLAVWPLGDLGGRERASQAFRQVQTLPCTVEGERYLNQGFAAQRSEPG